MEAELDRERLQKWQSKVRRQKASEDALLRGLSLWQDCAAKLAAGEFRRIVILTGAGVSTSAGIPDYRGEGGFSAEQWKRTEKSFKRLLPGAEPTPCHRLVSELVKKGWVRRVYTQNVDGLHEKSGVVPPLLMPMHGTVANDDCVAMGEQLPDGFWDLVARDFALAVKGADPDARPPDLLLVLGTSLKVAPACALPNMARKDVPRWWVCLKPPFFNDFGPNECVCVGKVRVSCRLTMRRRSADRVFDLSCDDFAREALALLLQQTPVLEEL